MWAWLRSTKSAWCAVLVAQATSRPSQAVTLILTVCAPVVAKEAREQLDGIAQVALDALVESAAHGAKPDWAQTEEAAALEHQIRYAGRAIERVAEHLIPLAQIANLREEAHALETRARALEGIAQERAEKLLGQIREAVSGEIVLPVDLSKGVSGALLAQARTMRDRAVQLAREADDHTDGAGGRPNADDRLIEDDFCHERLGDIHET